MTYQHTVFITGFLIYVHVSPVFRAVHFHFELTKVHDKEKCGFIGGQDEVSVFEKAFILVQVGILSHSIGDRFIKR